eukprot:2818983-Rhodomonas_salina.4
MPRLERSAQGGKTPPPTRASSCRPAPQAVLPGCSSWPVFYHAGCVKLHDAKVSGAAVYQNTGEQHHGRGTIKRSSEELFQLPLQNSIFQHACVAV